MINKEVVPHLNNLVFVEGGAKAIKKYKKLLLNRIKWFKPQDQEGKLDENCE